MKTQIIADDAYQAPSLLSQAIEVEGLIFTSGFVHVDKDGKLIGETTKEKIEIIFGHIEKVLEVAGASLDDVVKVNIYVTDMSVMKEFNETHIKFFKEPYPVREAVGVKELPLGADIEVSVVAQANWDEMFELEHMHCSCQGEDCDCEHGHCHCENFDCECEHIHCECVDEECKCEHNHKENEDKDCDCGHEHCHCEHEECDCEHSHCKCVKEKCECDHKH